MKTFSVKNFERFQHYKDRSPPWIKLYNELLDDYEFGRLPDASKMHLIAIWLLASRSDNKIPYDPTWVARRINANTKVDLVLLACSGFIVVDQSLPGTEQVASDVLAESKQDACLEREESRDREETEEIAAPLAGEGKKPRRKAKRALPEDFSLSSSNEEYAKSLGFNEFERRREHQKFCNHAKQNDRRCVEWNLAEHNWLTNAAEYAGKRSPAEAEFVDDGLIEVLDDTALTAWDAYSREHQGKAYPRNKRGGWRFPTKWPPGHDSKMLEDVQKILAAHQGN